jgi:hypothetical protein
MCDVNQARLCVDALDDSLHRDNIGISLAEVGEQADGRAGQLGSHNGRLTTGRR